MNVYVHIRCLVVFTQTHFSVSLQTSTSLVWTVSVFLTLQSWLVYFCKSSKCTPLMSMKNIHIWLLPQLLGKVLVVFQIFTFFFLFSSLFSVVYQYVHNLSDCFSFLHNNQIFGFCLMVTEVSTDLKVLECFTL